MAFGLLNSNTPVIAVDFGASALKVLQVSTGEEPGLIAAASVETPAELIGDPLERLVFQLEALPGVIASGKFRGKRLMISIPALQTWVQHLQVQRAEGADLKQLIPVQLQTQTGHDPSSLVIRHYEVCETQRGSSNRIEAICVAVRRGLVMKVLETLRAHKLEVVGVHSEHIALCRAIPQLVGSAGAEEATLAIDLGYSSTKLVITHGDTPVFAKTIEVSGSSMDAAAAEQLGCGVSAARTRRLRTQELCRGSQPGEHTAPAAQDAATAVAPVSAAGGETLDLHDQVEGLTDEIAMCLRYHDAMFPDNTVRRTVFLGGESRHDGLCGELARAIRLSAHVADPIATLSAGTKQNRVVNVDFSAPQPGWALPLGLCLSPADM